jgi:hypothetical protein
MPPGLATVWIDYSSSSRSFVSSILISLNSLDSKMSPHSLHSTYSESSSRETICTCGCLQSSRLIFCWLGCEGCLGVIAVAKCVAMEGGCSVLCSKLAVFCDGPSEMSSPQSQGVWSIAYGTPNHGNPRLLPQDCRSNLTASSS